MEQNRERRQAKKGEFEQSPAAFSKLGGVCAKELGGAF